MTYLFKALPGIKKYLANKKKIYIFSDFDGTLVPIRKDPRFVRFSQKMTAVLQKIYTLENVRLIIVSGRDIMDLKKHLRPIKADVIALHGFQQQINGRYSSTNINHREKKILNSIFHLAKNLSQRYSGTAVEQKAFSIAVHYRNIDSGSEKDLLKNLNRETNKYLQDGIIKNIPGKKVSEFIINKDISKGTASRKLLFRDKTDIKHIGVITIGDDITDRKMFAEFPGSMNIYVGKNESNAEYYLNNISDVQRFLLWLYAQLDSVKN